MNIEPHHPLGATITDLSLRDVDDATVSRLRMLLAEHGVLVLPDQPIDDDGFVSFLRHFGELTFTVGETPVEGFDDLNIVTNVGRTVAPRSVFHTDTSYVRVPPAYTALRAVEVPEHGGETLFTNQYRAAETLPDDIRSRLVGRTVTHVMTGLDLDPDQDADAETSAEHPILRTHPLSMRTAVYVSTPQRCVVVSGMDADESAETICALLAHSTSPDNIVQHRWKPHDLVIWDNRCVLHRADHSDVVGNRVLHRGMVADVAN